MVNRNKEVPDYGKLFAVAALETPNKGRVSFTADIVAAYLGDPVHIGKLLVSLKSDMKHGEFVDYVDKWFPFTIRTANRYMRAYRQSEKAVEF